eukprot:TRINITY_DN3964_c0_g1_i1.p1 TRINITY_DN3964_c0_g1~~TRINITY_DN3964_c0_g1_i1.p1  ORF type:complete len:263 (-),score=46.51 TRINITY_DN3964_c0_g1_i1:96-884(-)
MEGIDDDILILLLATVVGSVGVIGYFILSYRQRQNNTTNNVSNTTPRTNSTNNTGNNNEQPAVLETNNASDSENRGNNSDNASQQTIPSDDSIHIRFKVGENERSYYLDKRSLDNNPPNAAQNDYPITIRDLKKAVFNDLISSGKNIRFIFMGLMMEDHHRIKWYNISSGMVVHVIVNDANQNRADQPQNQNDSIHDPLEFLSSIWTLYVILAIIFVPLWGLYIIDSNQYFNTLSSSLLILSTFIYVGSVGNSLKGLFASHR